MGTYQGSLRPLPDDLPAVKREFIEELRRVYYRTGMTMRALEATLHVSDSNWSRYLNGATPIPDSALRSLAQLAGLRRGEWRALVGLRDRAEVVPMQNLPPDSGSVLVPRQLPAAATSFTGRAIAVEWLDRMLDSADCVTGTVPVLVLDGSAGVGKTALAVHWAHRVAARFPAGQLFVDLQGHTPESAPLTSAAAVARLVRGLGVDPPSAAVDVEELAVQYRSLVADRRLLVVLDNAASDEQVRPLIPGGSQCVVLVTTRFALTGLAATHGACHYEVGCLCEADALALLDDLLENSTEIDRGAAADLARQCAYLPLALRIAAARLQTEPHLSLHELTRQMAAGDPLNHLEARHTAVRVAFDTSYNHLSDDDRRAFRLLAAVPGPEVDVAAMAALLEVEPEVAQAGLARLTAAHLVEEHAAGRFRQHDLLRAYAAERHESEDGIAFRNDARRRLFDMYLRRAFAAADLIAPGTIRLAGTPPGAGFADPAAAIAWARAEQGNLVAAVTAAAASESPSYAWRLADALRVYFRQYGDGADWLLTAQTGLVAACEAGDRAGVAAMEISLGQASWRRGDFAVALGHLGNAVKAARAARWTPGLAVAHSALGTVLENLGRLAEAARHHRRALVLERRSGDPLREATHLTNLGGVFYDTGRLAKAAEYYERSLVLRRNVDDTRGVAINLANLGMVRHQQGCLGEARANVVEALAAYRAIGGRNGEIECLDTLAQIDRDLGDLDSAHGLARTALEMSRAICDRRLIVETGNTLGTVKLHAGQYATAAVSHAEALVEAQEISYRYGEVGALLGMAEVAVATRSASEAIVSATAALAIARDANLRVLEASALAALASAHLLDAAYDQALATCSAAVAAHQSTGQALGLERTRRLLAKIRHASGKTLRGLGK